MQRWATAFNVTERLALFALSATIGLVDLAVALFVAAYLGVIPKSKVETFRHTVSSVPVVGQLFKKDAPPPRHAGAGKPAGQKPKP